MYKVIEVQEFGRVRTSLCRDEKEMKDHIESLPTLHYLVFNNDRCAVRCAPDSTIVVIKERQQ